MKIVRTVKELSKVVENYKKLKKQIGFVPTMGSIHDGHIKLVKDSIIENDLTVCSIFVNPIQFNNLEDLENYPREEKNDFIKLRKVFCDVVFVPDEAEIYPEDFKKIKFRFSNALSILEGEKRPGHFNGVLNVVKLLFEFIKPDRAYFGEKDYQQLWIISKFKTRFNIPTEIKSVVTVRSKNGLALSSRNKRMNSKQIIIAQAVYKALTDLRKKVKFYFNQKNKNKIEKKLLKKIKLESVGNAISSNSLKIEYFEIVDVENFNIVDTLFLEKKYRVLIAVYVGKIRLIDNISI